MKRNVQVEAAVGIVESFEIRSMSVTFQSILNVMNLTSVMDRLKDVSTEGMTRRNLVEESVILDASKESAKTSVISTAPITEPVRRDLKEVILDSMTTLVTVMGTSSNGSVTLQFQEQQKVIEDQESLQPFS